MVPTTPLPSGSQMPQIGLGTWKSQPNEVKNAVRTAIEVGYRHVDCAAVYGNEEEIGEALEGVIQDGIVRREELFITSKLWNNKHVPEDVKPALQKTLSDLRISYLDLYLMHWPIASKAGEDKFPKDTDGNPLYEDVDYLDTWKAMEMLVDEGLAKNIGVSNFNAQQLKRLVDNCRIKPANLQIELHPFLDQSEMIAFCQGSGISLTAYSPFASPDRPWTKPTDPHVFKDETMKKIADSNGRSPAQVALRYLIQQGSMVIPKSVSAERMTQNLQIFDFALCDADMATIKALNQNYRACPGTAWSNFTKHPFL